MDRDLTENRNCNVQPNMRTQLPRTEQMSKGQPVPKPSVTCIHSMTPAQGWTENCPKL